MSVSENGFTKSYRSKWEHPAFRNYAEAAVWAWMCDCAAWRRRRLSTKFGPVTLERGQLLIAQRNIARDFEMGRKKVRLLVQRLVQENMISLISGHPAANAGTICTILNYDKYQLINGTDADDGAHLPPEEGPPRAHLGPTWGPQEKEGNESKEEKKEEKAPSGATSTGYRFAGETVRLNEKNYTEWQRMCPTLDALNLFEGTLIGRDLWYQDRPAEERKNWFLPTSNYMRNQDRKAAIDQKGGARRAVEPHWAGDDYIDPSELPTLDHYL